MIRYKGIKKKDKVHFIIFINDKDNEVEIPLEDHIAERFSIYLDRIALPKAKLVERENDEPSE
ncbi:hypothetical protein LCGC14_0427280 [marine sediment metagenome]|uniref:Uncharacterized protein n=1 Tax=marine sediment metagenome TaxID=412755 RepID=A0A0F9VBB9_9ZZZZ